MASITGLSTTRTPANTAPKNQRGVIVSAPAAGKKPIDPASAFGSGGKGALIPNTSEIILGIDVLWFDFLVNFPITGVIEKIYVDKDTGLIYQWDGATYVELSQGSSGGSGGVFAYANLASFPLSGDTNTIYITIDTDSIYYWTGSAYVELSQDTGYSDATIDSMLSTKADLVGGLVPSAQLPSYVDDVLEYANLASFPVTGSTGKIYVSIATGLIYRWSGSAYVEISPTVIPTASDIDFTPTGTISSNKVQTAIAELDSEKTTSAAVATQLLTPTITIAVETVTAASISGTYNYAINSGSIARLTLSANATIGLTSPTGLVSGTGVCVTLFVNPATFTASWAADFDWGSAGAPTLTASKWNRIVASKVYGDTKWQVSAAGLGFSL